MSKLDHQEKIKIQVVSDKDHWWIKLRRGVWIKGQWTVLTTIQNHPDMWTEPMIGKYNKDNMSFNIIGTDEHYEIWRVKPIRKIPKLRTLK